MTICNTCAQPARRSRRLRRGPELARRSMRPAEEDLYGGRTASGQLMGLLYEGMASSGCANWWSILSGLTVAAFYGCRITRPPARYGFVDSRNNVALERLAEMLGCRPIDHSGRTECCYAAHDERVAIKLTDQHIKSAGNNGARTMVTPCPALPHGARRLPAGNREGHGREARHAGAASAAARRARHGLTPEELRLDRHMVKTQAIASNYERVTDRRRPGRAEKVAVGAGMEFEGSIEGKTGYNFAHALQFCVVRPIRRRIDSFGWRADPLPGPSRSRHRRITARTMDKLLLLAMNGLIWG